MDVSNVIDMQIMFKCTSLADISPLSEWNMSKVRWTMGMFSACGSLVDVSCLSDWDVSSVTNMQLMFDHCLNLKVYPSWYEK